MNTNSVLFHICAVFPDTPHPEEIAARLIERLSVDTSGTYCLIPVSPDVLLHHIAHHNVIAVVAWHLPPKIDGLHIAEVVKATHPATRTLVMVDGAALWPDDDARREHVDRHFIARMDDERLVEAISTCITEHAQGRLGIQLPPAPSTPDRLIATIKGGVGLLPGGSLFTELFGGQIRTLKVDRLERFAALLAERLATVQDDVLRARAHHPMFLDLVEDAAVQAMRALTEERVAYLAALLINGIAEEELRYDRDKLLLRLLGELSDAEMIALRYHGLAGNQSAQQVFYERHQAVLASPSAVFGASQDELDQHTVFQTHREHLLRLGLLKHTYAKPPKKGLWPDYDPNTGGAKIKGRKLTSLGRLLLAQIDAQLAADDEADDE